MALNWKREPWRKLYVREEGEFAALPFYVRALAGQLIKFVDDHGRIQLGGREPWEAIAFRAGATRGDRRLLREHVRVLLEDRYLVREGDTVRIRNFVPAQLRWDRVRGEHELATERRSSDDDPALNRPPSGTEPTTIGPRPSTEPTTKLEPSPPEPSGHDCASRSDPKRSETIREERPRKPRQPAKVPLDAGWAPSEALCDLAAELRVPLELEVLKFRDHAIANGRRQVDWDRSFAGWLRRAAEYAPRDTKPVSRGNGNGGLTPHEIANLDMSKGFFGGGR